MYELVLAFTTLLPGSAINAVRFGLAAILLAYVVWNILCRRIVPVGLGVSIAATLLVMFLVFVGVSSGNEDDLVLKEAIFMLSFIWTLFALCTCYGNSKNVVKVIYLSFIGYMLLKCLLYVAISLSGMNGVQALFAIREYVPTALVSFLNAPIPRVIFSNDFLLPFFVFWSFAMLRFGWLSGKQFFLAASLASLLVFLTLTRYLYVAHASVLILTIFLNFRPRVAFAYVLSILVVGAGGIYSLLYLGYDQILLDRLFGNVGTASTQLKLDQLQLFEPLRDSLVFGKGLGYTFEIEGRTLRDGFQAEVQWFSLITKLGAVGLIAAALIFSLIVSKWFKKESVSFPNLERANVLVFVLWLLAGFTNPVLFLPTSVMVYVLLYSVFRENRFGLNAT